MALVPAICTQCGAQIEVDDKHEAGVCKHCGTAFITEKAINQYTTYITNNNNFTGANISLNIVGELEQLISAGEAFQCLGEYSQAYETYKTITEKFPQDYRGWLGLFEASLSSNDFVFSYPYLERAILFAPISQKKQLEEYYEEYKRKDIEFENNFFSTFENSLIYLDSWYIKGNSYSEGIYGFEYTDGILYWVHYLNSNYTCEYREKIVPKYKRAGKNSTVYFEYENSEKQVSVLRQIEHLVHGEVSGYYKFDELISFKYQDIKWLVSHEKSNNNFCYMPYFRENIRENMNEMHGFPKNYKSGGCYIATCVYGSYDCPEVWTLRRFRDNTLDETWHGRLFIKYYYAISPIIVKWFGKTKWFKSFWKVRLDKMVSELNNKGIENTSYTDKY